MYDYGKTSVCVYCERPFRLSAMLEQRQPFATLRDVFTLCRWLPLFAMQACVNLVIKNEE